ncbi:sulfotransferase family 2 domain-containing protein [Candidatus Pelagibacter communis]|uniref:sulfotransferase family 2 domain-containing protein n=1 Tax=Candidatus Pelagibacter TaxID=198251 RepID=UPI003EE03694
MPLFFTQQKKILYIHIPKNGGLAITGALAKHGYSYLGQKYPENNGKVSPAHLTSEEINTILKHNNINVDFEFTVVRNPYTKLESEYFYQFGSIFKISEWNIKTFYKFKMFSGFNNFIKKELNIANNNLEYKLNHFKPQVKFLTNKTKVYKYENKFKDLKNDLQDYGINFEIGEKQYTRGRLSKIFKIKWEKSTIQMVNEFYKDDFETFGYEKK